jgi:RNA polymerase sigma factor (sigma-70 family)
MKLLESLPKEVLTEQEEFALAKTIQKTKSEDDVNRLVLITMHEAFLYAKRVCRARIADDELFSLCYTTLRRNALRFRPGGIRFFAFTKVAIRGSISRYWKTLDVVKNASVHETSDAECVGYKPIALGTERNDNENDLTAWMAILITGANATGAFSTGETNFHSPCGPANEPKEEADFDGIDRREKMAFVADIIERKLTDQEAMILDLVYTSGFNFQEIGNLLNITRSAAQLSHTKGLKKIRCELLRQKKLLIDK